MTKDDFLLDYCNLSVSISSFDMVWKKWSEKVNLPNCFCVRRWNNVICFDKSDAACCSNGIYFYGTEKEAILKEVARDVADKNRLLELCHRDYTNVISVVTDKCFPILKSSNLLTVVAFPTKFDTIFSVHLDFNELRFLCLEDISLILGFLQPVWRWTKQQTSYPWDNLRRCQYCGRLFRPKQSRSKFCCSGCRYKGLRSKQRNTA